ncbi:major facilitator superfamily domain-containing protein [Trichoderma breve]|uniref:Major facilitator superfamily domain-containing protein n=1 Tax=Trichoderma breve TaxID=2034170 RepID=A0A9W9EB87_9HYPO|nr:major facilitator superfamily domain-containing protein [Trichoderma breve]KAJ4863467.1 major facilitator superfamily domain-containing protein [Trichoderma breve]
MTQKPELAKDSQVEENGSLVRFSGLDDPDMPLNWPLNKKIITTAMYGFTTMGATLATAMHGVIGDIWTPQQRGIALVFYSFCTASGPVLGPVVGAALHDKWRWTEYSNGGKALLRVDARDEHVRHAVIRRDVCTSYID